MAPPPPSPHQHPNIIIVSSSREQRIPAEWLCAAKRLVWLWVDGGTVLSRYQNILFLSEFMRCEKGKGGRIFRSNIAGSACSPKLGWRFFSGRFWRAKTPGREVQIGFLGKAEIWLNYLRYLLQCDKVMMRWKLDGIAEGCIILMNFENYVP